EHDLGGQARAQGITARRVGPEAVRGETARQAETVLAAGDEVQNPGSGDAAEHLRDHVSRELGSWEPLPDDQSYGNRGVQMTPRDVAYRVRHRQHRQAKG